MQTEIGAATELEAPFAVRGDAPADVPGHVHPIVDGLLDFLDMPPDIGGSIYPIGDVHRAVFQDQQGQVGEQTGQIAE